MLPTSYGWRERDTHAELVKRRQEMLALAFRDRMTRGQESQHSNAYRRSFYLKVIKLATKVSFHPSLFSEYSKCFQFTAEDGVQGPGKVNDSPHNTLLKFDEEAERLRQFVDPHEVLRSFGPLWPHFILAFDDAHILVDNSNAAKSLFARMCYTLGMIRPYPIFSLFLSRAGNFRDPINDLEFSFLDPISEISFDDLAFPVKENTVTLGQVVELDWMSHLGRPLYFHFPSSFKTCLLP